MVGERRRWKTMNRFLLLLTGAAVAACFAPPPDASPGVSWQLARLRSRTISDVRYELSFTIPAALADPVVGRETVRFRLTNTRRPVLLDFSGPLEGVSGVSVNGKQSVFDGINEHIVIPRSALQSGENSLTIAFIASDGALNRNEEFLYTLFVPDRARSAFPCFDQPDLKGRYRLTLSVPQEWEAVANGEVMESDTVDGQRLVRFAETDPLSSYLFAFAAGRFQIETAERDGRTMRMYHRETDEAKVARNRDAIFDLHATALSWLEEYTGISYPFGKFDFVAVPSFQYGGMEHAGSILYRASSLFLDESATQSQHLGRASLIAHETTHMWFGDLVTMKWFDDVWMKEVFANFLAAKIVNPSFPDIDHTLRFFLAHHPAAYGIDRTEGANPIRQPLENLNAAGTLYGAIIYQKAPIVMQHLERLVGETALRRGLRQYLTEFRFGNATWNDLIAILDGSTDEDLRAWSHVWVEEPGRPTVVAAVETASGTQPVLRLLQTDPAGRGITWTQQVNVTLGYGDTAISVPVVSGTGASTAAIGPGQPAYVLAGGDGIGYGYFPLDDRSREFLLEHLPRIDRAVTRSVAWMALWEAVLYHKLPPATYVRATTAFVFLERDEQVVQQVLSHLETAFWRFLGAEERSSLAGLVEQMLWSMLHDSVSTSRKAALFDTFVSVASTPDAVRRLERLWRKETAIPGLPLAERHFTALAEALAVRDVPGSQSILEAQLARIENPDRRARFAFILPALSPDEAVRDSVFESFKDNSNREHEPWVLSAVSLLHHPLRAAAAEKYILPSLELLEEIQRTGDIFFPLSWLNATLGGHNTPTAATTVRDFLSAHPDYPPRLRGKALQAADLLFRAAAME